MKIACIGGINTDRKARPFQPLQFGTSNPVEVVSSPGGVGRNIAETLARLGSSVSLFSKVGKDGEGDALLNHLHGLAVDVAGVSRSSRCPTASYTAVLDEENELTIGLADTAVFEELDEPWCKGVLPRLKEFPLWVIEGNLPAPAIQHLLGSVPKHTLVFADPVSAAKAARLKPALPEIDFLFPDRREAAALSGLEVKTKKEITAAAAELRANGVGTVVITMGAEGVYRDDGRERKFVPPIPPASIHDVTGAGDAFLAGFIYGYCAQESLDPLLCGLAAASLSLECDTSVRQDITAPSLLRRISCRGPHLPIPKTDDG